MEFATGALGTLLPKLGELLLDEYNLQKGLKKGIKDLRDELVAIQAALVSVSDVPLDQLDRQVKIWANDVRELSFAIEDSIDSFMVRVEGLEPTKPHTLFGFIKKACKKVTKLNIRREIANDIKDIKIHVKEVKERYDRCKVVIGSTNARAEVDPRLLAMYSKISDLVGIEKSMDELTERLLSEGDGPSSEKLKVVSVVGFGGLGKTTLAKAVYDKLKKNYDCGVFVPVGQSPDTKKVLRDILLELDRKLYKASATMDERQLINELQTFLVGKRITRKGMNRTMAQWLAHVGPYVAEWETATTRIWDEDRAFDAAEFDAYWNRYNHLTRLRIINHPQGQEMPAPATRDTYPSYDISGSRQNAVDMTLELHQEVASYTRQLSSTALLEPRPVHSFFTRIEGKLRAIYHAMTCTRSTDIVFQPPQVRPPRHSTGQQQQSTQHRHQPRPRIDHQWMSRPPPPDQPGSSAWQHHHDPTSGYGFRPDTQQHPPPSFVMHQHPTGAYGYRTPMSGHEASHSESTFDSAPDGGHDTQEQVSQHITDWMNTYYSTPVPDPTQPTQHTQDTQYGDDGSWIPLRNVQPPNRYGWSTPPPPQPRRGRGRRG